MAHLVQPADRAALERRTRDGFRQRLGRSCETLVSAPGRANLLGEHTDYNDGFVLPFAIARRTAVAAARRFDGIVHVESALEADAVDIPLDQPIRRGPPRWGDYVRGVLAGCIEADVDAGGFDAWIDSDVPPGAGLSSSAALEVAFAGAIEALAGQTLQPMEKADLCRRAEQVFADVPCGVMDQMASLLATEDTLLLIDCRDRSFRRIAIPAQQVTIAVVDSGLPHDLGEGEFARRVAECREAARRLGVPSLRDATREQVEELAGDDLLYRRALHVVEENARVLAAADAIRTNDWSQLGRLLDESHASLRDLYEVSRPEMDELVRRLREAGAFGARMTGGGFGGCAVALFDARVDVARAVESALAIR